MNVARMDHCACTLFGMIYAIGGIGEHKKYVGSINTLRFPVLFVAQVYLCYNLNRLMKEHTPHIDQVHLNTWNSIYHMTSCLGVI